ncbi:hypothetical protein AMAG_04508 [Allomyces macrogynus ATCC 38327]|uniref:Uncharacterized protein n=1 Tax=Allomyces macrogynus (strain ATCC 38327) TaxID=578462 RepID=A0A0L0S526_ALLM3|nr:hypothetical protein AMAG_04508 [Allomyces macrogynus ATCC 38327]|eukprot:KNE57643.1 hypothetical protein AMAG_04508 [Allomyces macrogynus ATCC 38327]
MMRGWDFLPNGQSATELRMRDAASKPGAILKTHARKTKEMLKTDRMRIFPARDLVTDAFWYWYASWASTAEFTVTTSDHSTFAYQVPDALEAFRDTALTSYDPVTITGFFIIEARKPFKRADLEVAAADLDLLGVPHQHSGAAWALTSPGASAPGTPSASNPGSPSLTPMHEFPLPPDAAGGASRRGSVIVPPHDTPSSTPPGFPFVGYISLTKVRGTPDLSVPDPDSDVAVLEFGFRPELAGVRYPVEALEKLLEAVFAKRKDEAAPVVRKVAAKVLPDNALAAAVLKGVGFVQEKPRDGHLRFGFGVNEARDLRKRMHPELATNPGGGPPAPVMFGR